MSLLIIILIGVLLYLYWPTIQAWLAVKLLQRLQRRMTEAAGGEAYRNVATVPQGHPPSAVKAQQRARTAARSRSSMISRLASSPAPQATSTLTSRSFHGTKQRSAGTPYTVFIYAIRSSGIGEVRFPYPTSF